MRRRSPLLFGWLAMLVIITGWVISLAGFGAAEEGVGAPELRRGLRLAGFCLMIVGSTMAVQVGLRGPIVLMLAGVVLNLAYQAGVVSHSLAGGVGASWVLLGAIWGSRSLRRRVEAGHQRGDQGGGAA